ncbi:MAG: hypothetical protein HZC37_18365 [Burkholderiales bacterium]|nr:hypothetical protein [Burkholderiales bacterium]
MSRIDSGSEQPARTQSRAGPAVGNRLKPEINALASAIVAVVSVAVVVAQRVMATSVWPGRSGL